MGLRAPRIWRALKKISRSLPAPQVSFLRRVPQGALARRENIRLIMHYHRRSSCLHQAFGAVNFKKRGKKCKTRGKRRRHGVYTPWGSGGSTAVVVAVLKKQ